jgi:HD-like signal output (HDOD) protein
MDNLISSNDLGVNKSLSLAMLLHDIGKVVLKRYSPQKYKMAQLIAKNERKPLYKVEETIIQVSHAEAGSVLMDKWEMDDDLVIPVMYHHRDELPQDYIIETALIQLVNWIDNQARDMSIAPPSKELLAHIGFDDVDKTAYINFKGSSS